MVVKIACIKHRLDEMINTGNASFTCSDIVWQIRFILAGIETSLISFNVVPYAFGMSGIDALPIVPPGELLNKLFNLFLIWLNRQRMITHLVEAQDPLPDVG